MMKIFKDVRIKDLFNEIGCVKNFENDFKKILKKFKTIEEDFIVFISNQLKLFHKKDIDNRGVLLIPGLEKDYPKIYKATKFACKSLKGRGVKSGIRIIYAYFEEEDIIEFIEIYYKGSEENEDKERIREYLRDEV